MKISKSTLSTLKNFAGINRSIIIEKGSKLSTISNGQNVLASYVSDEKFPRDIHLYDLNEFLSAISLFEDPDFNFKAKSVEISSGSQSIKYPYAEAAVVQSAKPPEINQELLANPEMEFDISESTLSKVLKSTSVIKADIISLVNNGKEISVIAQNKLNKDSNQFQSVIEDCEHEESFDLTLLVDNMKIMPIDYTVSVYKQMVRFRNEDVDIEYIISLEDDSNWG